MTSFASNLMALLAAYGAQGAAPPTQSPLRRPTFERSSRCVVCEARIPWQDRACAAHREQVLRQDREPLLDRARATIPARFRGASLETFRPRLPEAALASLEEQLPMPHRSLVLVGPSGVGKTTLAAALLRAAIDAGAYPASHSRYDAARGCVFATSFGLSSARRNGQLGHEAALVGIALDASLLVLDDLGNERDTPWSAVRDIVWERHAEGRPTIYTTWLDAEGLERRYDDGAARRVYEDSLVVQVGA